MRHNQVFFLILHLHLKQFSTFFPFEDSSASIPARHNLPKGEDSASSEQDRAVVDTTGIVDTLLGRAELFQEVPQEAAPEESNYRFRS